MPRLLIGIRFERFQVGLLPFGELDDVDRTIAFERTADFIYLHQERGEHRLIGITHTTNVVAVSSAREQVALLHGEPVCRKAFGCLILLQQGIKRFVGCALIHEVLRVCHGAFFCLLFPHVFDYRCFYLGERRDCRRFFLKHGSDKKRFNVPV